MRVLVVRDAFGDYAVGAIIRDPAAIAEVQAAGQAHFCTPTEIDEAFFAEPEAEADVAKPKSASAAAPVPAPPGA